MHTTVFQPKEKAHAVFKVCNCRASITHWRLNPPEDRVRWNIERSVKACSCVQARDYTRLKLLRKRICKLEHLKCNGIEHCILKS